MALGRDELRRLLKGGPLHELLGLELTEAEPGGVRLWAPYRDDLLADERRSYVHGGVLALLADVAGDFAFATLLGATVPTVDMRVDYLRGGRPGHDLIATATVVRRGRRLGVADAVVADDTDRELVVARCLYSLG